MVQFTGPSDPALTQMNLNIVSANDAPGGIGTIGILPQGRVTLTSGAPVMTASASGATAVLYTPHRGALVPIWNGTQFITYMFSETSQLLTDATKSPAAAAVSSVYDMFVWNDAGQIRCTRGPVWTNTTTRSAGTALTLLQGILTNSVAITNGPAQYQGTYVGTVATNAAGTVDWTLGTSASGGGAAKLMVWNYYNRIMMQTRVTDTATAYTYTTATIRQANNSTGNQINYVCGVVEDAPNFSYQQIVTTAAAAGATGQMSIGDDSVTAFEIPGSYVYSNAAAAVTSSATATYLKGMGEPMLGVHYAAALEKGDGTNANTFNVGTAGELSMSFMM